MAEISNQMSEQVPNNKFTFKDAFIKGREWFNFLLSKWLIIVVVGLLGGGLGFFYAWLQKPSYKATLTFALEDQQQDGRLGGALSLASQFGFDLGSSGGGMFASANLIELFKSRTIIQQTLMLPVKVDNKTISYAEMFIQGQEWRKKWAEKPALKDLQFLPNTSREQFTRTQDSVMGAIYEIIIKTSLNVIQKDKKVDIITLEMKSGNESFAKNFTEALAQQVSDFYISSKNKKARMNMEIIQKQTDSIRGLLNGAITDVAVANDNTFGLNPALNVQRTTSTRRQIDVQYNVAILAELIKQTELARVTLRKETPLIQVIDKPIPPLPKEKLGKLMGLIIGGILGGLLIVFILVFRRLFKQWMA